MTGPIPLGGRWGRLGLVLTAAAVTVVVATAMAWLPIGDDTATTGIEHDLEAQAARERGRHEHLPPYDQRYAAATPEEQAAADELLTDVRTTLAAYADVDAATDAGYQPPRRKRGRIAHYLNRDLALDGDVLDPAQPTGLVYLTAGDRDPVLLGAFFVAPKGATAPTPAGDLVVWHSHSPECPRFFATAADPCSDARRMLHVWTFDRADVGRRTVRVADPFGVPLRASVERVDG